MKIIIRNLAFTERKMASYTDYCRRLFGHPMQKLTLNAGFSCPNRDGTLGTGGCTFCNNEAFNPQYCQPTKSITQQIDEGIAFHSRRRRHKGGYLAYMQAYSNTYAPLEVLRQRYEEALSHPMVSGLVIGTRPDCVDEEKLDYLGSLAKEHYIMVEYGIESCYDRTLTLVHRGHDFACTTMAIRATAERGIHCGGHLILGLPGESCEDILKEAEILSELPLECLKLHQLQILKGTLMEKEYQKHPEACPPPFSLEEYVSLVCEFRQRLRADIIIERYASEVPPRFQAMPNRSWRHSNGKPVTAQELSQLIAAELNSHDPAL